MSHRTLKTYQLITFTKAECDNHRGIFLLSIAGKILATVILNQLMTQVLEQIYPESQCGFCSGRDTTDMVFAYRQLQEKCREQNKPLYSVWFLLKHLTQLAEKGSEKYFTRLAVRRR